MGKYQVTVNMGGLRVGKVGVFDDFSPETQRLVANNYLVPYDKVAKDAQEAAVVVEAPASTRHAIMEAIQKARAASSEDFEDKQQDVPSEEVVTPAEDDVVEEATSEVDEEQPHVTEYNSGKYSSKKRGN